ncbi:MAG TPA: Gfo/Idh/MocA family oxidoreductase [Planctomycetota bacterium]|nr:Gfo/Idh/MocA family oxidoreductase [Planctomycetota bacterium]
MPLRIGILGLGHLGKFHAETWARLAKRDKSVTVAALCDPAPAGAAEAKKYSAPFFADYRQLENKVDAVSVVVPTVLHREVGGFFLERGVSCLIEKPLAVAVAEAQELVALASKSSAVLQVGHVERFNPIVRAAAPYFGRPRFIDATRVSPYPFRSTDVSVTLDLMIHDIDLALSITHEDPVRVYAAGAPVFSTTDDIANARLEFSSSVANVAASRVSLKKERKWRIFQEHGYLSLNLLENDGVFIEKSEALKSGAIDPGKLSLASIGMAALTFQLEKLIHRVVLKGDKTPALEAELASFAACVAQKSKPVVDGADGLRALKVAEEIARVMRKL